VKERRPGRARETDAPVSGECGGGPGRENGPGGMCGRPSFLSVKEVRQAVNAYAGACQPPVVDDRRIEEILDTIGDQHAREVLAAISREPKSAKELAEECDLSLPTIYRRVEMLDEYDLVKDRTLVADDGNHYKVYESNFESTVISLEDDEYRVRIYREENVPDRFGKLWDELSQD
jgi:DNA-binding HxlR family transcriptional regulator